MIPCKIPWKSFEIGGDGFVFFCCFQAAHGPALMLGNIHGDTIENILNGPIASAIRWQIIHEDLPKACSACPLYEQERKRLSADGAIRT